MGRKLHVDVKVKWRAMGITFGKSSAGWEAPLPAWLQSILTIVPPNMIRTGEVFTGSRNGITVTVRVE